MQAFVVAAAALALGSIGATRPATGDVRSCPSLGDDAASRSTLVRALAARKDILGDRLLASPTGPTLAAVRRLVPPLFLARGPGGLALTTSGVYPVVFAMPTGLYGDRAFALHVADGSEIVTRRIGGPSVRIVVGPAGDEPYGSCLGRLAEPRLRDGFLPILETTYTDSAGNRYRQESFATRQPGSDALVSYVRLRVLPRSLPGARVTVRLLPSTVPDVHRLRFADGGRFDGHGVRFDVTGPTTITFAWLHSAVLRLPGPSPSGYELERTRVETFWRKALSEGVDLSLPEPEVMNAARNLLVQELVQTWRYSVGNRYEELSFAEGLDAAQVMAAYGFADDARAILRFALRRLPERFSNWRAGATLAAVARIETLAPDRAFLTETTPTLARAVERLGEQLDRPGSNGVLAPEQFSNDIGEKVVSLHGQLAAWQGLTGIARTWRAAGRPALAARADQLARRLASGLTKAIGSSLRRVDGSLFVPADLLSGRAPFADVTETRAGSYWNLVFPYALASGFIAPRSQLADGAERYLRLHGARLLGLVRSRIGTLTAGGAASSGVDQVYGLAASRFLADRDEPERLVLALYGTLGAAMTEGTYQAGEATSIAPLGPTDVRETYLPPNSGANATFLETLRLVLVRETRDRGNAARGLDLAFATPRPWLRDGGTIRVRGLRTAFGPLGYTIARRGDSIRANIDAPAAPRRSIRLRLPVGLHAVRVTVNGRPRPVDPGTGAVDLPATAGRLVLRAAVARSR